MIKKGLYLITILNILFQIVYTTLGKYTQTELGVSKYVFYVFRAEYMVVSGIVALLDFFVMLITVLRSIKSTSFLDIIVLLLNIEYIVYYIGFLMKQ